MPPRCPTKTSKATSSMRSSKKQRILVIVDRLSERSAATQAHIVGMYRSAFASEALVITTRVPIRPNGAAPVFLYPQPLNAGNLLRFMLALIEDSVKNCSSPSFLKLVPEPTCHRSLLATPEDQLEPSERASPAYSARPRTSANPKPPSCPSLSVSSSKNLSPSSAPAAPR